MQATLIERALSTIAEVRRQEIASALLMTLLIFLLLDAYYLMKTAREILILSEGGAAVKSYSSAGQALLLLAIVPAYASFASRVSPVRLVTIVTLFFASHLVLFALGIQAGLKVGIVYFIWVGIFNVMVVAQFWAFAADLYSEEQGRRLFPLIGIGASLGAWIGSLRAGQLVGDSGPVRLLLGATVILLVCTALVPVIKRFTPRGTAASREATEAPLGGGSGVGLGLILADRYLVLLALLTFLLNVVNTSGEYLYGRFIVEQAQALYPGAGGEAVAARERFIGETYSQFYSTLNLLSFLLQTFVVSRLFKWLGVGRSLFIHPIVALVGYLLMLRAPSLQLIGALKVADNGINYSLTNTARQALWLPTSREAKYKAKQVIDSFVVRAGDVALAGIVFVGEGAGLSVAGFAAINILMVGAWLVVVGLLSAVRGHKVASTSV